MKRSTFTVPLISAIILTFASCGRHFSTFDGQTWGTNYHIVYLSDKNLSDSITEILQNIDNTLSMFNDSSEISRLNRNEKNETSDMFRTVFGLARTVWNVSEGMYDPTVGNLCDIWGFGKSGISTVPSDSLIAVTLLSVGMGECDIDAAGYLTKKNPETKFDFSSIAKGFGIDCIGNLFERNGVENYMIEIGGEILAKGLSPRNKPWRIQIDSPHTPTGPEDLHERYTVIDLGPEKTAIASSGNYRNRRRDQSGTEWGHTLSPKNGYPVKSEVLATSIIGPSCALADALATAAMALPPDKSLDAVSGMGYEALILSADSIDTNDFSVFATKNFSTFLAE